MSGLAFLALACGQGAPSGVDGRVEGPATPPGATPAAETGDLPRPPDLVVKLGDASITAGIGTYCWTEGGRGVCVDAVGVITPNLALVAAGQPPLTAELPRPVESARATAWRADELACDPEAPGTAACGALPVAEGSFAWPAARLGERRELPVEVEDGTLRATSSLESGVYVVSLSLFFEGGGDVDYGVLAVFLSTEG